jgi:general secretion pathway protein D
MDSGEGGMSQNVVKFQAISRLNSILVVSQKPEYLKRAQTWIARLDRADTQATNLKSYPLRYGSARQVTALLNEMLTGKGNGNQLDSASSQISPGAGISMSSSGSGALSALSANPPSSSASAGVTGASAVASGRGGTTTAAASGGGQDLAAGNGISASGNGSRAAGSDALLPNVRITADINNNAVLVFGNQEAQRLVEQTIRQIDRPQRQIAIEATIAEVTLNDTLHYGVQFYLASKDVGLKPNTGSLLNTIGKEVLSRTVPGFNFLVGSEAVPRMVLDALHNVTNVKVLSNPSLVVLDNQTATLQVGDQVPVSTGTATVLTANNTIVNTIDYRNTGIILRVQPRSNANGNVVLDIEQEISNIAGGGGSQTLTPTVSQRRVRSSIAVTSGQTVLLAGLISETDNRQRQGIPVLDQIPGIGDVFAHPNNVRTRTELILFIRPTVVRDAVDAHVIAEEMRTKMHNRLVGTSLPVVVNPAGPR